MIPMEKTKVIFFGTQEFAVIILQSLIESSSFEVIKVLTQPDQPVGRKQVLTPPPVKSVAEQHHIPVEQPISLKGYALQPGECDLSIVAQYGRIIPASIIEAPTFGTLNVHTSLLPKYRGASPIQFALWQGETETGVTIMKMDAGMDTGPILLQKKVPILPDEIYPKLNIRLAHIGASALLETIPGYLSGEILPKEQRNDEATYTKILTREDGKINWQKTASEIYNHYRGFTPWPGLWCLWESKRLKLLQIKPAQISLQPGQVVFQNEKMYVGCSGGSIEVLQIQPEGKGAMEIKSFINGYQNIQGVILS